MLYWKTLATAPKVIAAVPSRSSAFDVIWLGNSRVDHRTLFRRVFGNVWRVNVAWIWLMSQCSMNLTDDFMLHHLPCSYLILYSLFTKTMTQKINFNRFYCRTTMAIFSHHYPTSFFQFNTAEEFFMPSWRIEMTWRVSRVGSQRWHQQFQCRIILQHFDALLCRKDDDVAAWNQTTIQVDRRHWLWKINHFALLSLSHTIISDMEKVMQIQHHTFDQLPNREVTHSSP